jgi:hypothetical protein
METVQNEEGTEFHPGASSSQVRPNQALALSNEDAAVETRNGKSKEC